MQQHVVAPVAEVLGDGEGDLRALDAQQRRFVARHGDDDAARQPFLAQVALDEVLHLAPALADQRR